MRRKRFERSAKTAGFWVPALAFALAFSVCFVGCKERRERCRAEREARRAASAPVDGENASYSNIDKIAGKALETRSNGRRPATQVGLTANALLAETVAAYSNAKYYSDAAYFETVCERIGERGARETYRRRVPCSFGFAKPNFVRFEVGSAVLRSDGETVRAEIRDDARAGEFLESPAPMMTTSVKELYPDAEFAVAAGLVAPPNVFWAPPQSILLLARDPLATLVPPGSRTRLLRPEYLRFENPETNETTERACDLVCVDAPDGPRVLWIDRETKALARFEFPVEGVAAPENVDRVVELRLEFPNQTLSDSAPSDLSEFQLEPLAGETGRTDGADETASKTEKARRVDRFLPADLQPLGRPFPKVAIRSTTPNAPGSTLGEPTPGKTTVVAFWRAPTPGKPGLADRDVALLKEFERAARFDAENARFDFLAVDVDAPDVSDAEVDAARSSLGVSAPTYRLAPDALRQADPTFPLPSVPSIVVLDETGVVRRYCRSTVPPALLRRRLATLLGGRETDESDFNAYYAEVDAFVGRLADADETDVYRVAPNDRDLAPATIPPRRFPKTFGLRERWKFDDLCAPSNPIAISESDREFDAFRAFEPVDESQTAQNGESAQDASKEQNKQDKQDARTDGESEGGDVVPIEAAREPAANMLVVPCDGNALALLTPEGRAIRKIVPATAVDEPISFVRTVKYGNGKRFYVASSRLQSRKARRFDERFDDLGTLDVGAIQDWRIGDARFVDVDGDRVPELALGLVGSPSLASAAPSGVYAVEMATRKIRWKDESILNPRRLDVRTRPGATPAQTLLATNRAEGVVGTLVEDDASTGERLGEIRVDEGESIAWVAATDATATGESNVVAVLTGIDSNSASFVGIGADGSIVWRNPIEFGDVGQMEPIVSGDLDGDGVDEWIVASPDGELRFFAADGRPIDSFQYGAEISGVCVARWNGASYLIVADPNQVVAWLVEQF